VELPCNSRVETTSDETKGDFMGKGRSLLRLAAYVVLVASGGAIVWSSRLYFLDPIRIHFLMERPLLVESDVSFPCWLLR